MRPQERFFTINDDFRSPYARDRDRIIHSGSFRRLEYKTQVFLNSQGDFFRTRLTHSIEVSQIARSISSHLGLQESLAESIAFFKCLKTDKPRGDTIINIMTDVGDLISTVNNHRFDTGVRIEGKGFTNRTAKKWFVIGG